LEDLNPYLYGKIQLNDTDGLRYFFALSTAVMTNADDPVAGAIESLVGFRYIPSISNQFYIMAKATGSATTFIPTGIAVVEDQNYHLEIKIQSYLNIQHAFFYINNTRVGRLLETAFQSSVSQGAGVFSSLFYVSGTAKQMGAARFIWSADPNVSGYPFSPSAYLGGNLA
jgi:hypothetical protein